MNLVTKYRRESFDKHIQVDTARGLEIGPYNRPMVRKSEGPIVYMDYLSRADHVAADPEVDFLDEIPETDIIIKDNDYQKYTSLTFDYIIANHVAEHAPDFIGFLAMLSSMLKPNGILFMALPDKKFSFDRFRANTSLAHLLSDHLISPEMSMKEHLIEDLIYYDRTSTGRPHDLSSRLTIAEVKKKMTQTPHYGLHCHVFQSETILETVLNPLTQLNCMGLSVLEFSEAHAERGGEMIILLQKKELPHQFSEESFYDTLLKANSHIQLPPIGPIAKLRSKVSLRKRMRTLLRSLSDELR